MYSLPPTSLYTQALIRYSKWVIARFVALTHALLTPPRRHFVDRYLLEFSSRYTSGNLFNYAGPTSGAIL